VADKTAKARQNNFTMTVNLKAPKTEVANTEGQKKR